MGSWRLLVEGKSKEQSAKGWAKKWVGRKMGTENRKLLVVSGTTLRVVVILLAEMREHPGGSAQDMAMQRAKDGDCELLVES